MLLQKLVNLFAFRTHREKEGGTCLTCARIGKNRLHDFGADLCWVLVLGALPFVKYILHENDLLIALHDNRIVKLSLLFGKESFLRAYFLMVLLELHLQFELWEFTEDPLNMVLACRLPSLVKVFHDSC